MKRLRRAAAAIAVFLAFCSLAVPAQPSAGATALTAGTVDSAAAARIISDYRAKHGLPPVKVDPQLTRIAASHARKMASADALEHVLSGEGSFMRRITDGGYMPLMAAENIGAGYKTLADAMIGWETSRPHNANLLNRDVTEIGIALYVTSAGIYHAYWSLVLARPLPPAPAAGADAAGPVGPGPLIPPPGGLFRRGV
jgi:uncharacterized protein YkwD